MSPQELKTWRLTSSRTTCHRVCRRGEKGSRGYVKTRNRRVHGSGLANENDPYRNEASQGRSYPWQPDAIS